MALPYEKITGFRYEGEMYDSEAAVIKAMVKKRLDGNSGFADKVIAAAHDIVPLLNRYMEVEMEQPHLRDAPVVEAASKDATTLSDEDDASYSGGSIHGGERLEV